MGLAELLEQPSCISGGVDIQANLAGKLAREIGGIEHVGKRETTRILEFVEGKEEAWQVLLKAVLDAIDLEASPSKSGSGERSSRIRGAGVRVN